MAREFDTTETVQRLQSLLSTAREKGGVDYNDDLSARLLQIDRLTVHKDEVKKQQ